MLLFDVGFVEIQGMATVILFALCFYLLTELRMLRRDIRVRQPQPSAAGNNGLVLQAYERLTLLTDRMTLKNLIARLYNDSLTAEELQAGMIDSIRKEFEHNITQQIYINPDVWKAIAKMKEQNMFIINQLATALPPNSPAMELSNLVLEYGNRHNAELAPIVLEAIQFEVKKLV